MSLRIALPAALFLTALVHAQDGAKPAAPAAGGDTAATALTVGSPAPTPDIETFVRGQQPEWFAKDRTYVIEFWATWCGPCRMSMPHLSDLAEKYKDRVVVVGVSDEPVETVTAFLDKPEWKQKARYNLATDPDRTTHKAYMEASGQGGIPTAFIVRNDVVQWIGHPMQMDTPLAEVVAGTWDAEAFRKSFDAEQAASRKRMARRAAMIVATKNKDWDAIVRMYDEDIASAPGAAKDSLRVQKMQFLLSQARRYDEGYALGREIVAANTTNPMVLNQVAWFILDTPKLERRDLDLAMATAKAAVDASKGADGSILDTLARAYWEKGDRSGAISTQRQAIEKAGEGQADELRATLEKYEKGTAPAQETKKTAFRAQDAKPAAPLAPKQGDAPAAKPAAPARPDPNELSPSAQKTFPETPSEGFDSVDAAVAFLPTLRTDPEAGQRMMKAMHAGTPESRTLLRVMRAMFTDMQPMIAATVKTFQQPVGGMFNLPKSAEGGTFFAEKVEDATATVGYKDKDGKPVGQPVPMTKVDGKWYIDFTKASGGPGDAGAQTAMMANMLGQSMRDSVRKASEATAKEILDGKYKSAAEAQSAFSRAMQMEMARSMGMGEPGMGGAGMGGGAPRGPGGGMPRGAAPGGAAPAPPAGGTAGGK